MVACSSSPMARRTSLMHRIKESSVTTTSGQTAAITSSLEMTRPGCSAKYRNTSKLFGLSSTSPEGPLRHNLSRSSVNGPN